MANPQLPGGAAGRELQQTLTQGEPVLAHASGKGGALLVATDRRAIIIKAGVVATAQWFGKKNASFGYGQITSVDLHTGALDGYVEISAGGVAQRQLGRYAQLVYADNVCPFNKWDESAFRYVVDVIRWHLYSAPARGGTPVVLPPPPPPQQTIPDQIAALARLRDSGAISLAEFEAKKAELLRRM